MKLVTHDTDTLTISLAKGEITKLAQIAKLAAAQFENLDEAILDLSRDDVKKLAAALLEVCP